MRKKEGRGKNDYFFSFLIRAAIILVSSFKRLIMSFTSISEDNQTLTETIKLGFSISLICQKNFVIEGNNFGDYDRCIWR